MSLSGITPSLNRPPFFLIFLCLTLFLHFSLSTSFSISLFHYFLSFYFYLFLLLLLLFPFLSFPLPFFFSISRQLIRRMIWRKIKVSRKYLTVPGIIRNLCIYRLILLVREWDETNKIREWNIMLYYSIRHLINCCSFHVSVLLCCPFFLLICFSLCYFYLFSCYFFQLSFFFFCFLLSFSQYEY